MLPILRSSLFSAYRRSKIFQKCSRVFPKANKTKEHKDPQCDKLWLQGTGFHNSLAYGWRAGNLNWPIRIQEAEKTLLSWRKCKLTGKALKSVRMGRYGVFKSIRYRVWYWLRYRNRVCDVIELTGKSRDLADQVQGCLTLWLLVVIIVQYFLVESTTQINKSMISDY